MDRLECTSTGSVPESTWCGSRGRSPERELRQLQTAWASCRGRGMYGMEQCCPQIQRGKERRCQPAEPGVICTHLCFRTSFEPPESGALCLARQKLYRVQGGHRHGGSLMRLPKVLYSHNAGDRAAKDILGCGTGCGRVLSVLRFRGWCPPQC